MVDMVLSLKRQIKLMEVKESGKEKKKETRDKSHDSSVYGYQGGGSNQKVKKEKYIFILFKINKKGLIAFITRKKLGFTSSWRLKFGVLC